MVKEKNLILLPKIKYYLDGDSCSFRDVEKHLTKKMIKLTQLIFILRFI